MIYAKAALIHLKAQLDRDRDAKSITVQQNHLRWRQLRIEPKDKLNLYALARENVSETPISTIFC